MLSATHRLISLRMYELIREIMHCNRKGIFKRMFLEARVIELLLLQLEQMDEAPHPVLNLKKPDIDKLYAGPPRPSATTCYPTSTPPAR